MPREALLTRSESRAVDQALIAAGVPGVVLMENAGRGAAERIAARMSARGLGRVTVLVGPGNNGGDGLVVARQLVTRVPGVEVAVLCARDPSELQGDAAVMRDSARAAGLVLAEGSDDPQALREALAHREVIVDALFGTGLARPLDGVSRAMVEAANATDAALHVALDAPSGLDVETGSVFGETAFRASLTLTFAAGKPGLYTGEGTRLAGEIEVVDLGVPLPSSVLSATHWMSRWSPLAPRDGATHKGRAGHVLVVGGSAGMTGAALLAARGAHRAGAGLVTVASRSVGSIEARVLETMTAALPDDIATVDAALLALVERCDAFVVGPGLGLDPWALRVVRTLWNSLRPGVFDADAFAHLRRLELDGARSHRASPTVLTPHPRELARLRGVEGDSPVVGVQSDRIGWARSTAARESFNAHVLLKGAGTVVATPDDVPHIYLLPYAEPTLGIAGSGDVLAGAISARLAELQGGDTLSAVLDAAHAHGRAGEALRRSRGGTRGALASEIADALRLE